MATDKIVPTPARLSSAFHQLVKHSAELNAASDELAKAVAPIDTVLKQFNLGVNAWHKYHGFMNEYELSDEHYIGYAKVNGKWGLAISRVVDNEHNEEWLFNDAPRAMRIEAVKQIPELLDSLVKRASETSAQLRESAAQALDISSTLTTLLQGAREKA